MSSVFSTSLVPLLQLGHYRTLLDNPRFTALTCPFVTPRVAETVEIRHDIIGVRHDIHPVKE